MNVGNCLSTFVKKMDNLNEKFDLRRLRPVQQCVYLVHVDLEQCCKTSIDLFAKSGFGTAEHEPSKASCEGLTTFNQNDIVTGFLMYSPVFDCEG